MIKFSLIEISRRTAADLALRTHKVTAMDSGYQIKSVLAEAGSALRPWRFLDAPQDTYRIVGVESAKGVDELRLQEFGGRVLTRVDWAASNGETVEFDLHVAPMIRSKTSRGHGLPKINHIFDAALGATDRGAAYRDWFASIVRSDNIGIEIMGQPQIGYIRDHRVPRKFSGAGEEREVRMILIPGCRVRFKATITNVDLLIGAISSGVARQRAFGFGTLIPRSILTEMTSFEEFSDVA